MSAVTIRRAAALIRDNAGLATPGPWEDHSFADGSTFVERVSEHEDDYGNEIGCINSFADAAHIASWHPAVALAVADLMDEYARLWAASEEPADQMSAAPLGRYFLAVAIAYPAEPCHCGQPVAYGYDGDPTHHRGMCEHCDAVRCDVDPRACREAASA